MKLAYYPYQPFKLGDHQVTMIDCGHSKTYLDLIWGLQDRNDEVILSDDQDHVLSRSSMIRFVGDVSMTADYSAILKDLITHLNKNATPEQVADVSDAAAQLTRTVMALTFDMDVPLVTTGNLSIVNSIRFAGLSFDDDAVSTPYGIIETVIKALNELRSEQLLVLANVTNYLGEDQFNALVEMIGTSDVKTLIIEHADSDRRGKFPSVRHYWIDHDFNDYR